MKSSFFLVPTESLLSLWEEKWECFSPFPLPHNPLPSPSALWHFAHEGPQTPQYLLSGTLRELQGEGRSISTSTLCSIECNLYFLLKMQVNMFLSLCTLGSGKVQHFYIWQVGNVSCHILPNLHGPISFPSETNSKKGKKEEKMSSEAIPGLLTKLIAFKAFFVFCFVILSETEVRQVCKWPCPCWAGNARKRGKEGETHHNWGPCQIVSFIHILRD